jgi:hypothetical protein
MKKVILIGMLFFSCNLKDKGSLNTKKTLFKEQEKFDCFLKKFTDDSLYQASRIDKPLKVITAEDDVENQVLMDIQKVSFNQKDWSEKIVLNRKKTSNDTINVVLQGIDTGIYIEHFFVKRNGLWFLFKIKNLSD